MSTTTNTQETAQHSGRVIKTLPVAWLERHPGNRRPTEADVKAMALSLHEEDQLEPLLVRRLDLERYQIISGETRQLAALKLIADGHEHWRHLDCEIRELSDADALRILAVANGQRNNLDPIQRAELIERLCDDPQEGGAGLTRYDAARAVGLGSASAAANAVRLLKLPEAWRQRVASGELGESLARELLLLNQLGQQVAKAWELAEMAWVHREQFPDDPGSFHSRDAVVEMVGTIVDQTTRPMPGAVAPLWRTADGQASYLGCEFDPDDETTEKLCVVWIWYENWQGDRTETPRATNVELWDSLQFEAVKSMREAVDEQFGYDQDDDGSAPLPTTTLQAGGDGDTKAQALAKKVERWKRLWLRHVVALALDHPFQVQPSEIASWKQGSVALGTLLLLLADEARLLHRQRSELIALKTLDAREQINSLIGKPLHHQLYHVQQWLQRWLLWDDDEHTGGSSMAPVPDEMVRELLSLLEIDLEEEWIKLQSSPQRTADDGFFGAFLKTHDREQLDALADELGVKLPTKLGKAEAIQVIQHAPRVFPVPKCLELPKTKRKAAAKGGAKAKAKKGGGK